MIDVTKTTSGPLKTIARAIAGSIGTGRYSTLPVGVTFARLRIFTVAR